MRKMRLLALALVGVVGFSVGLTGCGDKKDDKKMATEKMDDKKDDKKEAEKKDDKKDDKKEVAKPGESGFAEKPIGDEFELGPYVVQPVYFQPVDMYPDITNGVRKEDGACHLEADIHLKPEKSVAFGFGEGTEEEGKKVGAWVPYLKVEYTVTDKDGKVVDEGAFMPMNADDGPHYGANLAKSKIVTGEYKLSLKITPPAEYLLHIDDETGVAGAKKGKKEYEEFYKTLEKKDIEWKYEPEW